MSKPRSNIEEINFKKKFPELYKDVISLSFPEDFKFTQKLYHFFHDDLELKMGLCPMCGKRCPYRNIRLGYRHHCSPKCAAVDVNTREKRRKTVIEKYGEEHYSKTDEFKEKYKQTCQERYGCDNYAQTEECKEKYKQTCQELYGCDNAFQNEEIKEKIKQTCLEKYGCENPSQSDVVREKYYQTCLERYGIENTFLCENARQTCLERYGDIYYMRTDEFREKSKQTCLEKYGVPLYIQTQECQEKRKQTCLERYGEECVGFVDEFHEKRRQTCLERYGVPSYTQTQECREKQRQTCLERYGVPSYSQTHESATKRKKRVNFDNLTFDSSWEVIVYQYCQEHNIPCEYQPNVKFTYEYEGKTHVYQPDFIINGKICEVKGEHFYDGDKMICPFDRTQDGLFEAKHQCMIQNNVIVIRQEDINKLKNGENIFE